MRRPGIAELGSQKTYQRKTSGSPRGRRLRDIVVGAAAPLRFIESPFVVALIVRAEVRHRRARAAHITVMVGFPSPRLRAFSLVELLVVITIIGILIALLLPAIQAAREAARRIGCSNNLHQIGIGLHGYHQVHDCFPPGGLEYRWTVDPQTNQRKFPDGRQFAWSAFILPYMEQQSLYDQIDFGKGYDKPENAVAAATVLSVYLCPSTNRTSPLIQRRGACDYGGIYGERIRFPGGPPRTNDPPKGTMLYERAISIREITDGTSNTLVVSEDAGWMDGQWINGANNFDQFGVINSPPSIDNEIRSYHTHGANGLFADGSVHFLNEEMKLTTLAAICTRAGGEVVEAF